MSITATNNPYPDSPDPSPSKLDRGGYEGTADTLDKKIDSTLAEAELLINNFLTDSTLIGNPNIAIPAEITGNAHCIGVGPGTYAFWGGMVIPANNIGTLKRVNDVYSVSLMPISNTKITPWTAASFLSGDQVNYLGKDWVSNATTVAGDIPGTSIKWIERLKFGREINEINQKAVLLESGKNLLNPLTIISGDISETTGVLSPNPASTWRYTNYIKVPSSTQVSIKLCYKIAEYDINKVFITGQVNASQGQKTITTNVATAFIVIYGYNTTFASNQVEISATSTTYEAFYIKPIEKISDGTPVSFKNHQVDADIIALKLINSTNSNENLLLERYKNLFNVADAVSNFVLDSNGNAVALSSWGTSGLILVNSGVSVACNKIKRYAEYNSSGVFVPGTYVDLGNIQYTKVTSATTKFIRISYILSDVLLTQVEYGASSTSFEPYTNTLKVEKTQTGKSINFVSASNNPFKGKKLLAIGDSITASLNYQVKVGAVLEMTVTTHALGGIGIIAMVDGGSGLSALTSSQLTGIDFLIFFGGLNDRGTTDGTVTDLYPTQDTLAGRYNYALNKIFTLAKSIGNNTLKVIAIAPHKCGKYSYIDADGDDEYPTGSGRSLLTQVDILKKVCQRKSVPIINLYELSGINEYTWDVFSATSLPTNGYTYKGEFANIGSLPIGVLNDVARVVGTANAYVHNGTSWNLGTVPYPYNSDQLHLSENGNKRIADIIVSQLKTIYNGY